MIHFFLFLILNLLFPKQCSIQPTSYQPYSTKFVTQTNHPYGKNNIRCQSAVQLYLKNTLNQTTTPHDVELPCD